MLESIDLTALSSEYVIPWSINIGMAVLIFVVGRLVVGLIMRITKNLLERSKMDAMLIQFLCAIMRAILLLFVIIAALGKLGVDTSSLVALIAAAGLAIGLSLQSSLQNFAAGVMLILFRPFKVGDFVDIGGTTGTVEVVAIFTTTMRTGDNKEVIVPNGSIYGGTITNYSTRATRRVDMIFGISYDDDLRAAKDLLLKILVEDERVLADPAPVVAVCALADSSVNFNVRPWVNTPDYWNVLWDTTEKVKLAFDEAGISIPYPQMDVHTDRSAA